MMRLITLSLLLAWSASAATWPASTASRADVQTAINSANDGDTVTVPSGNVSWTTNVLIQKAINFIGSGIGSCIITDSVTRTGGNDNLITWTLNNNAKAQFSGFEFRGDPAHTANPGTGIAIIAGNNFMFRVCSNAFNLCNNRSIQLHGWVYGVADHNIVKVAFKQFIEVWHDTYGGGSYGDLSWQGADLLGTTNCFRMEDNVFMETTANTPGMIDMMGGARCAVRFNTFSNCNVTTHGTESSQRARSVRTLEVYNNTFTQNSGFSSTAGQYRGGTGIVCSNSYTGPDWAFGMSLTCYREIEAFNLWGGANGTNGYDSNVATVFDSGTHDGANAATPTMTDSTKNWTASRWVGTNILWNVTKNQASYITANTDKTITFRNDGDTVSGGPQMKFDAGDAYQIMSVYAALDQPGRGQQTSAFDAGSSPATPQVWPDQALSPVYSWSNTVNGTLGMNVASSYPSVLANREYYQNTIKPGWTPLTYPDPLAGGTNSPAVAGVNWSRGIGSMGIGTR